MVKRFQLQSFDVSFDESKQKALVMFTGARKYYDILYDAFPNQCEKVFSIDDQSYDWGTFIHINREEIQKIQDLMRMFTYAVCLEDQLKQSFALDYYYRPYWTDPEGGITLAGRLVHQAKYFPVGTPEQRDSIMNLCDYFSRFIELHPSYQRSDFFIAVPYYGNKNFDLPQTIVQYLSNTFDITIGNQFVSKNRSTRSMKSLESREEKENNIQGAFTLVGDPPFSGKIITIIDDVYRSGTTLAEFANILIQAGATVQGLVATKTIRD